ncbi:MAG: 5'-nucleotidase C-terminal domain-containing protein [Chloroflexota bacterium]
MVGYLILESYVLPDDTSSEPPVQEDAIQPSPARAAPVDARDLDPSEALCAYEEGDTEVGQALFEQPVLGGMGGCKTCHSLEPDVTLMGPSLYGIATIAETRQAGMIPANYIYLSIMEPNSYIVEGFEAGVMPDHYADHLDEGEIADLVNYLMTLRNLPSPILSATPHHTKTIEVAADVEQLAVAASDIMLAINNVTEAVDETTDIVAEIEALLKPVAQTEITLLHVSNVSEMMPTSGGQEGDLARLATLKNQLVAKNPNTFLMLSGSLFGASSSDTLLGAASAKHNGFRGRPLLDVINEVGVEYATFGNQQSMLDAISLAQLLEGSTATWAVANALGVDGQPFPRTVEHGILTVTGDTGHVLTIGLFGVTDDSDTVEQINYTDPFEAAAAQAAQLRDRVDILIAMTHLPLADDLALATHVPGIDLILGSYDRENVQVWQGRTMIAKADANARSAYVHHLVFDHNTGKLVVQPRLQQLTDNIAVDPSVAAVVHKWEQLAFDYFRAQGFEPDNIVATLAEPLDATAASILNEANGLTKLINTAMMNVSERVELSLFHAGMVTVDERLPRGVVNEYDVIRMMPDGGTIQSVVMNGSLLRRVLEQGLANQGTAGYLQMGNVRQDGDGNWLIGPTGSERWLDQTRMYVVAVNDTLLMGDVPGLEFLDTNTLDQSALVIIGEHGDIRHALIDQLKATYGAYVENADTEKRG